MSVTNAIFHQNQIHRKGGSESGGQGSQHSQPEDAVREARRHHPRRIDGNYWTTRLNAWR